MLIVTINHYSSIILLDPLNPSCRLGVYNYFG
jgi:hypothetical protein